MTVNREEFRAIGALDAVIFCSKLEILEGKHRVWHPYSMNLIDSEDGEGPPRAGFLSIDPWNPDEFMDIESTKVEFNTPIDDNFSSAFLSVLERRLKNMQEAKSAAESKNLPGNVVLLKPNKFN